MTDRTAWKDRIGTLGVWTTTDALPAPEAAALAREIEDLGYGALWLPETVGRDPFAHIAYLGTHTERLVFATGIANIHHRHPGAMKQAAWTLAEQTGGRFILAVGVSHAPLVEGLRGLDYGKPLATMRTYLQAIASSPYAAAEPAHAPAVLVGALGPKMVELSGTLGDGTHPYWGTPDHTAEARQILGPDALVCVEQKVVLTTDRDVAHATTSKALGMYRTLPNYRNNWIRLGFTDEEIDGDAPRFLDALVAWGDLDALQARIEAHLAAGADHVCIQPMTPSHPLRIDRDALAALAPTN